MIRPLYFFALLLIVVGSYFFARERLRPFDQIALGRRHVELAPDFTHPVAQLGASQLLPARALSEFRNQPVFLHFFASWCLICRAEQPMINELVNGYAGRLQVLAVASYDEWPRLQRALSDWPLLGTVLYDEEGRTARRYKIQQLPASILINERGEIVERFFGPMNQEHVERLEQWFERGSLGESKHGISGDARADPAQSG